MSGHFGGNPYAWGSVDSNTPHISRYFLASGWVIPDETVLDAACCTGYGSHIISLKAQNVIGVETDQGAIDEAKIRWPGANIDYRCQDLDKIEWPDADVLISLETFEHVNDLQHCVEQAQKHIKRLIVVTVPLGGTSWDYTKEQRKTPAGECNDFEDMAALEKTFVNDEWKVQCTFQFGYSGFAVFFRKPPHVPEGYDEGGFPIGHDERVRAAALEAEKNG